jgi:hypothetical protein
MLSGQFVILRGCAGIRSTGFQDRVELARVGA